MAKKRSYAELEAYVSRLEREAAQNLERIKSLEAMEEHFQRTLENLREEFLFYRHDVNGRFTYVSPSYANILGYQPEEYLQLLAYYGLAPRTTNLYCQAEYKRLFSTYSTFVPWGFGFTGGSF